MKTILVIDVGGTNIKVSADGPEASPLKIPSGREMTAGADGGGGEEGHRRAGSTTRSRSAIPGPVRERPAHRGAREPRRGLGALRLREGLRQAGAGRERRGHAGARAATTAAACSSSASAPASAPPSWRTACSSPWSWPTCPTGRTRPTRTIVGVRGLKRLGRKKWTKHVREGGGPAQARPAGATTSCSAAAKPRRLKDVPKGVRVGSNSNAFRGGFRLWEDPKNRYRSKVLGGRPKTPKPGSASESEPVRIAE